MTRDEIIEKLKEIFKLIVNRNADLSKISEDSKIVDDLGVNSVGAIYLAIAIEEMFKVDVSEVSFSTFSTVKDVINYIEVNI
jgi:acyl carrier protein